MDDVLCDYTSKITEYRQNSPDIQYPQSLPGFFRSLAPIEGALAAVEQLRENKNVEVYILTAPSTKNPLSYSEKRLWVEDKFGYEMTHNLIICSNKGLLKGDVLIDDHISGRGQELFEGKLIHFGQEEYPDWDAVLKILSI
jgi:5'(3')-deoxyribonucleotidase